MSYYQTQGDRSDKKLIVKFDMTKLLSGSNSASTNIRSEFSKLQHRLKKRFGCDCCFSADDLSSYEVCFSDCNVMLFVCPQEGFGKNETLSLNRFLSEGGSLCFLGTGYCVTGAEKKANNTLPNEFLRDYGIQMDNECVIRTAYHNKFLNPKHVFITNGSVHPALDQERRNNSKDLLFQRPMSGNSQIDFHSNDLISSLQDKLQFVYPFGTTLSVQYPAITILSSGPISFPINRPIAAVWEDDSTRKTMRSIGEQDDFPRGRIVVLGSKDLLTDEWIDKEENGTIADILFKFLLRGTPLTFHRDKCQTDHLEERRCIPDVGALSQQVRTFFQGADPLPQDYTSLFVVDRLFKYDRSLIPECIDMYEKLDVKHEPLSLIPPEFVCPFPPLKPAVFHPRMPELPCPALDLFDLDEQFASDEIRLAQLTNKCQDDDDLEYYILEAADILGLYSMKDHCGELEREDAKSVLDYIFRRIVDYKMRP